MPARFAFTVKRAWWQTRWFFLALALLLALGVRGVWKWRMKCVLNYKAELERTVAARTPSKRWRQLRGGKPCGWPRTPWNNV